MRLTIKGNRSTGRAPLRAMVATLADAVRAYEEARDGSGEGASTFADGEVVADDGARVRISYNGRCWLLSGGAEVTP